MNVLANSQCNELECCGRSSSYGRPTAAEKISGPDAM